MITDAKRKEIEREAEEILRSFSEKLGKVKIDSKKREKVELSGFRKEGEGELGDADFRDRMFRNAPEKDGDSIVAERKSW